MKYPFLYRSFNEIINLPEEAYLDLESRLIRKKLDKNEYLIYEGQVIEYLPFINKGLMVNYRLERSGYLKRFFTRLYPLHDR